SCSMAHGRVPMGPRYVTAAPWSGATDAPAMVSLWTSMPMKSVRDCDLGDLRVFGVDVATSSGTGLGKLTRVTAGGNLPPLEVIMSRPQTKRKSCSNMLQWPGGGHHHDKGSHLAYTYRARRSLLPCHRWGETRPGH